MRYPTVGSRLVLLMSTLALISVIPGLARACCNVIPIPGGSFAGAVGVTNRPYSSPGENVEIGLRDCDATSFPTNPVVTVVFKRPEANADIVVLGSDRAFLAAARDECGRQRGVRNVVVGDEAAPWIDTGPRGARLVFQFPDTTSIEPGGLSGAAAIAMTESGDPLPCWLATEPCSRRSGLRACVDSLYEDDGSCGMSKRNTTFSTFTGLPPANDFGMECMKESPPCRRKPKQIQFAVGDGNVLVPMYWGTLLDQKPVLFHVRGITRHRSNDEVDRIDIPSSKFLSAYTPEGAPVPPLFEPDAGPIGEPRGDVVRLHGTADTRNSVLRIAQRRGTCNGGDAAGTPCTVDADCPGGRCPTVCVGGPDPGKECTSDPECSSPKKAGRCGKLFVLGPGTETYKVGKGHVCERNWHRRCRLPCIQDFGFCVGYALESDDPPALLDSVLETPDLVASSWDEKLDNRDRNGDGDATDRVVTMLDTRSGVMEPLGDPSCGFGSGPPVGRAVVTGASGTFRYAAMAAGGRTFAFLEPVGDQAVLRIYEPSPLDPLPSDVVAKQLTDGVTLPADTAPVVNARPLAVSGHDVFYRTPSGAGGSALLRVFDAAGSPGPDNPHTIAPAAVAAIDGERVALLGPEGAPGVTGDLVVQVWSRTKSLESLHRAADAVALSGDLIAALVPDRGHHTVAVRSLGGGDWKTLGVPADAFDVAGGLVAFLAPERDAKRDLNGDGDQDDRVLHVYRPGMAHPRNLRQAAEEFVLGSRAEVEGCGVRQLIAFRTPNDVLKVYDAANRKLFSTETAVVPCRLPACDLRFPYRVAGGKVRFLEPARPPGGDRFVVNAFDTCSAKPQVVALGDFVPDAEHPVDPLRELRGTLLFTTPAGRCVAPGTPRSEASCVAGTFFDRSKGAAVCTLSSPSVCRYKGDCPGAECDKRVLLGAVSTRNTGGERPSKTPRHR